jgi:hypothetical protein
MKQLSFFAIDLVMSVQLVVTALGIVCAIYLLLKMWKNK